MNTETRERIKQVVTKRARKEGLAVRFWDYPGGIAFDLPDIWEEICQIGDQSAMSGWATISESLTGQFEAGYSYRSLEMNRWESKSWIVTDIETATTTILDNVIKDKGLW